MELSEVGDGSVEPFLPINFDKKDVHPVKTQTQKSEAPRLRVVLAQGLNTPEKDKQKRSRARPLSIAPHFSLRR